MPEDRSASSWRTMQCGGARTPKNLGTSPAGSRSSMVTVMPAADPCQTTFVTVKMDNDLPTDITHTDDQEPPLSRTAKLSNQETFTAVEKSSRVFPNADCSESSSTCAEGDHGNGVSKARPDSDRSRDSLPTGDWRIACRKGGIGSGKEHTAAQGKASLPSTPTESSNESSVERLPLQQVTPVVAIVGKLAKIGSPLTLQPLTVVVFVQRARLPQS